MKTEAGRLTLCKPCASLNKDKDIRQSSGPRHFFKLVALWTGKKQKQTLFCPVYNSERQLSLRRHWLTMTLQSVGCSLGPCRRGKSYWWLIGSNRCWWPGNAQCEEGKSSRHSMRRAFWNGSVFVWFLSHRVSHVVTWAMRRMSLAVHFGWISRRTGESNIH